VDALVRRPGEETTAMERYALRRGIEIPEFDPHETDTD
jgi:hypothetical protein